MRDLLHQAARGARKVTVTVTCSPAPPEPINDRNVSVGGYCSMGMGQTLSGVERVIERFTEHAASIRGRFQDDQSFREMCGDYAETLQALHRWRASNDPLRDARVEEYEDLARALESEILTALSAPSQKRKMT